MTNDPVKAPTSLRTRKKQATKKALYDGAVALFMEHGYDATTIEDIVEVADVGRATFFNYYASKVDVLHEIAADALNYAGQTFDREFEAGPGSFKDRLKRAMARFGEIVERNPKYYKSVFLDAMRSQAGFVVGNRDTAENLIKLLSGHLRNAQKQGELNKKLNADQLAEMLTGIYMYTILSHILMDNSGSLPKRLAKAAEIFFEGCKAK